LDEEMRWILQFCDWKAKWWRDRQSLRSSDTTNNTVSEGLKAFAEQQAAQEIDIANNWEAKWRAVRVHAQPILGGILHQERPNVGPTEIYNIYMDENEHEVVMRRDMRAFRRRSRFICMRKGMNQAAMSTFNFLIFSYLMWIVAALIEIQHQV
jgi:hypothetical protein